MLTRRTTLGMLMASPFAATAFAQSSYPGEQPVKLIVTFAAGGTADITGRLVARVLQERLKQSFVVENRTGAGGTIGLGGLAQSKPDGYTLAICAAGAMVMLPHLMPKMPFDVQKDFQPITVVMSVPQVMAIKKDLGVKTVAELIAMAKAKPGMLSYGSAGHGTSLHLATELFRLRAGNLNIQHVPYRGVAPALTDLMGGQIDILFGDIPVLLPQIQAGTILPLAVTARQRAPVLPDVPTMEEAGVKDAEAESFYGVLAPAGLPKDRLALLHSTIVKALEEPETKRILVDQGGIIIGNTPEEFTAYLAAETKKWGEVVRLANIRMQ
jgi:tripartite-type tricarboxylate transporter receptor subunit TctC